jgi:membrane protein
MHACRIRLDNRLMSDDSTGPEPAAARPGQSSAAPVGIERDTSFVATMKRTATEFVEDEMSDRAAGLTYYGLLSLFPALIALVSIVGLVFSAEQTTDALTDIVSSLGPDTAADTFAGPVESVTDSRGASGLALVIGLSLAIYSASAYVGAFGRGANVAYETREGRPFWKLRPFQMLVTLGMILILALLMVGLLVSGPLVSAIGDALGIGRTAQDIWNIAKWPAMMALAMLLFAVLLHTAPNVEQPGVRWVLPGAAFALVAWILASVAFSLYVSNFGSYNKTYGALGGLVVLLIWMWISNLSLLFGLELNTEIQRNRQFEQRVAGAEREIQMKPRAEPTAKKTI